ncbi:MAG: XRE family transcriptional regulator [Mycobacterium sp.]
MPRTDENDRSLESLLGYVLDGVSPADIAAALGVSHATYYRRKDKDDYPTADEVLAIAHYFGLNPVSWLETFGYIQRSEGSAGPVVPPLGVMTKETKTKTRARKPKAKQHNNVEGPPL